MGLNFTRRAAGGRTAFLAVAAIAVVATGVVLVARRTGDHTAAATTNDPSSVPQPAPPAKPPDPGDHATNANTPSAATPTPISTDDGATVADVSLVAPPESPPPPDTAPTAPNEAAAPNDAAATNSNPAPTTAPDSAPAAAPKDAIATALDRANSLIRKSKFDEAEEILSTLIRQAPKDARIWHARYDCFYKNKKYAKALADIDQAIALAPDNPTYHLNRGWTLRKLGRRNEAEAAYRRVIELNPKDAEAWLSIGNIFLDRGDDVGALEYYDKSIALDPYILQTRINRAGSLTTLHRFSEARAEYDVIVERWAENRKALAERGWFLEQNGSPAEALADFDKSIARFPDYPNSRRGRGSALHKLGRDAEALDELDQILAKHPRDARTYGVHAEVLAAMGDLEGAVADCDKALELDPSLRFPLKERIYLRNKLAAAYRKQARRAAVDGDMDRYNETRNAALAAAAASLKDQALRIERHHPRDAQSRFNYAYDLNEAHQLEASLAQYDKAIELSPDWNGPRLNRLNILIDLHRYDEALPEADLLIERNPDWSWPRERRAEILGSTGNAEGAIAELTDALADGVDADTMFTKRASLYAKLGRFDDALADVDRAIDLDPGLGNQGWRANLLIKANRNADAAEVIEQMLAKDDTHAYAYNLRATLDYRSGDHEAELRDVTLTQLLTEPREANFESRRGGALKHLKRNGEAKQAYESALEIDPQRAGDWRELGWLHMQDAEYAAAAQTLDRALELQPENAWALGIRANAAVQLGDDLGAVGYYTRRLAASTECTSEFCRARGAALQRLSEYELAIADLDRAIELDPENDRNHLTRAQFWMEFNDLSAAYEDVNRSLSLNPTSASAYALRAALHRARGDADHAIEDANTALRYQPTLEDAWRELSFDYSTVQPLESSGTGADYTSAGAGGAQTSNDGGDEEQSVNEGTGDE